MLGMTPELNPSLWFELGLALMGTGAYDEGLRVLNLFDSPQGNPREQKQSEIAQTLKKFAEPLIREAKTIKPPPACGKPLIPRQAPTTDGKAVLLVEQTESQVVCSITTGVGYDGNVIQLGRGLPLPEGIAGKGAAFNETTVSLEGDWFLHHKKNKDDLIDKLAASYAIIHDAYDEHSDFNTLGQTAFINYCHLVNKNLCVGFQVADAWLRDDTQNLSNTLAPQASLSYRESPRLGQSQLHVRVGKIFYAQHRFNNARWVYQPGRLSAKFHCLSGISRLVVRFGRYRAIRTGMDND